MRRVSEYLFLWAVGGCLYYSFELLFRGFSHWSMFVLGGVCFVFFQVQARMLRWQDPLWRQVLRCAVFVTALEFITGIIVNKWLRLEVWDYTDMPFQILGQVCLPLRSSSRGFAPWGSSSVDILPTGSMGSPGPGSMFFRFIFFPILRKNAIMKCKFYRIGEAKWQR